MRTEDEIEAMVHEMRRKADFAFTEYMFEGSHESDSARQLVGVAESLTIMGALQWVLEDTDSIIHNPYHLHINH